ncbi:chemotaxis protein CheA [Chitinibacter sp. GC72]|uniref:chemotaxis protein CheA n=1 Tax=Chitinibacter sp. GC72 TaxID=1526917 RepID=UPI0012FA820A|nr:chemotaxis protein CheA [Chitinibacter sp. GC72]
MNLDAARAALVEEARELLVAMEDALLQIEAGTGGPDGINAIFRAAHTIKGSAGLFAFDNVVSFTHIVESVLDRVRNGKLEIDEAMLSLLLKSGDYIATLVDAIERNTEQEEPNPALRSKLEAELKSYLDTSSVAQTALEAAEPEPAAQLEIDEGERVSSDNWHLSLRFNEDVLRQGLDPLSFIRYLCTLGRIVHLHTISEPIPAAEHYDAESSYLGYEIDFESDASRSQIEGVFEFVREESQIRILPPHSKIDEYIQLIESLAEPAGRLGEILIHGGALSESELERVLNQQQEQDRPPPLGTMLVEQQMVPPNVVSAALSKQKQSEEKRSHEQKFIKVEVGKLDQLIDLVGELVIAGAGANLVAKQKSVNAFEEAAQSVSVLVEQIRDAALTLRMVPIGEVFQRFPRVVREVSRDLGKEIELVITGAETELDKSMVEKLSDPLMHIVRNAMDHGLESTEDRILLGKPSCGIMRLNAFHDSGSIVIEVSDDGRGLNRERILAKAIERGLISAEQHLSDNEIYRLIFEPGFSTAEKVTNLSGRGVGMDVVKKNIEALRGEVEVDSTPEHGATIRIRLPLTLAIIDGFQVMVHGSVYVIPLEMVIECVDLVHQDYRHNIIKLRGEPLPFIRLRSLFGHPPSAAQQRESLVVVQYGSQRAGLVVDQLLGEFQAVIKPLGLLFQQMKGIGGSTILGNGQVSLILDIPHLIHMTSQREMPPMLATSRSELSEKINH